jgi:hypothetical protein
MEIQRQAGKDRNLENELVLHAPQPISKSVLELVINGETEGVVQVKA